LDIVNYTIKVKREGFFTGSKGKDMMIKGYRRCVALLICLGTIFSGLHACMITFINDFSGTVMILNRNDKRAFWIKKNGRRRFGSADEHANFDVYVQQSGTPNFKLVYTCAQHECGKNGNPQVKFADLETGQEAAALFTITKNDSHETSMVQELPMIQKKKHCASCH
jgi:hypothetical protein